MICSTKGGGGIDRWLPEFNLTQTQQRAQKVKLLNFTRSCAKPNPKTGLPERTVKPRGVKTGNAMAANSLGTSQGTTERHAIAHHGCGQYLRAFCTGVFPPCSQQNLTVPLQSPKKAVSRGSLVTPNETQSRVRVTLLSELGFFSTSRVI